MNEENKKQQSEALRSVVNEGKMPLEIDLSNVIAAQKAIAKLPKRTLDPQALSVAKKYGLDFVPHV